MNWMDFAIRMFAALFLGGAIGLERQWRQRMTGLRTNGLVAVGAAMFIMMGGLISGDGSLGRVAAYVVSGIGFLGGGVILKDGFDRIAGQPLSGGVGGELAVFETEESAPIRAEPHRPLVVLAERYDGSAR